MRLHGIIRHSDEASAEVPVSVEAETYEAAHAALRAEVPEGAELVGISRWPIESDFDQAAAMAYVADVQVQPVLATAEVDPCVCRLCGDDECECDPERPGWRFFGAFIGGTSRRPALFSWDLFCQVMAYDGPHDADLDYHHASELVARCQERDHPAPDPNCECGYRIVDDLGKLHRYAMRHHWIKHLPRKYEGLIAVARVQGGGTVYGPAFGDPRGTLRFERLTITDLFLTQVTYDRPEQYGTAEEWREGFPGVDVHVPPEPRSLCSRWCRRGCTGCREWLSPAQWFAWIESAPGVGR